MKLTQQQVDDIVKASPKLDAACRKAAIKLGESYHEAFSRFVRVAQQMRVRSQMRVVVLSEVIEGSRKIQERRHGNPSAEG